MGGYEATKIIRVDFDEPKRSVPIISLSARTTLPLIVWPCAQVTIGHKRHSHINQENRIE